MHQHRQLLLLENPWNILPNMLGVFKHSSIPAGINFMWIQTIGFGLMRYKMQFFSCFLHQSED